MKNNKGEVAKAMQKLEEALRALVRAGGANERISDGIEAKVVAELCGINSDLVAAFFAARSFASAGLVAAYSQANRITSLGIGSSKIQHA